MFISCETDLTPKKINLFSVKSVVIDLKCPHHICKDPHNFERQTKPKSVHLVPQLFTLLSLKMAPKSHKSSGILTESLHIDIQTQTCALRGIRRG